MKMDTLVANILGWANDRNLIEGSTVEKQYTKLVEEFGEYAAGKARGKLDVQADALGDMQVISIIMAAQAEYDLLGFLQDISGAGRSYDSVISIILDDSKHDGALVGPDRAFLMMAQNMGALAEMIEAGEGAIEHLGLVFTGTVAMCYELGLEPTKVLEDVWNIIKDRKGRMVDGVFIKEGDAMVAGGSNEQA